MNAKMGEYPVGAYLEVVEGCEFVDFNVRPPGGGMQSLAELDVVGFDFQSRRAYLCEVVTHILGLGYGNYDNSVSTIVKKFKRQEQYARERLAYFNEKKYMLWSPVVPKGLAAKLRQIEGLELVINEDYADRMDKLREEAARITSNLGNPAFRVLQILEHMRSRREGTQRRG